MSGPGVVRTMLAASVILVSACLKLPPDSRRITSQLEVTNDYPFPMNVTVQHSGGLLLLGVIPPGESREFPLHLWYAQPVSVVATPLDDFLRLRRSVFVAPHCTARILLQEDVRIGQPVVVPAPKARDTVDARPDTRSRADSSVSSAQPKDCPAS
jgi:hypothetical protein